ncbi:MAG: hypothetical protein ISS23_01545 [Nanoarchaeota archaeon]|nr:hypothetical protein [Nanoarchaeota archaeon]
MKKLLLSLIFLVLIESCIAATIHGTIYDESLNLLQDVIVEIDSTPNQRYVAKDGTYSFTLPEGSYTITTRYDDQTAEEKITIEKEGDYILDLFLFPSFEEEDELTKEIKEIEFEDEYFKEEKSNRTILIILGIIAVLLLAGIIFYFSKQKKPKIKSGIEDIQEEDETGKYLEFIKKQGGRTTQREIRKHFPLSEAKISLIITELEHKGKIEKIKKGRTNIIILKNKSKDL